MKKLLTLFLLVCLSVSLFGCGGSKEKEVLNIFNAGEYIGEDVISTFEKKYNCRVNYSTFASNEELYTKLMTGASYDVLVPSDYMIERLIAEKMLQPIDKSIVTSLDKIADGCKPLSFDATNTYAVPYFWGNVGIVYDTNVLSAELVEEKGWDIFLDSTAKGNAYFYDSERDAFMVAFKALGYSMNTTSQDEIDAAYQWLLDMDTALDPSYVTDEVIDGMANGEKALAFVYSGDAAYILSENEDIAFYAPHQGTNIWVDCMVIPANAENPTLANKFIEFMLDEEIAYQNSEEIGYTSNIQSVIDELSGEGGEYEGNDAYLVRVGFDKDETFNDNEVLRKALSEYWVKVKLH